MFSSYQHKIDWIVYFTIFGIQLMYWPLNNIINNKRQNTSLPSILWYENSKSICFICWRRSFDHWRQHDVFVTMGLCRVLSRISRFSRFWESKIIILYIWTRDRLYVNSRNQYNDLSYHPSLRSWSFGRKLLKFLCKCWVIFTWQMRLIHSLVKYGTLYTWPDVDVTEIRSAWSCQFIIVCLLL